MTFKVNKEFLKENFHRSIIFISLFILIILAIKSGSSVSQQNVSTVVLPENKTEIKENISTQNPYKTAYDKCTHPKMSEYYQNKCIAWELKNNGIK